VKFCIGHALATGAKDTMGALLNSFERELKMLKASQTILVFLVGCAFTFGSALSDGAVAKDQRKLCGSSGISKTQACATQAAKIKTKKPAADKGKGISPGAALLLQLLF